MKRKFFGITTSTDLIVDGDAEAAYFYVMDVHEFEKAFKEGRTVKTVTDITPGVNIDYFDDTNELVGIELLGLNVRLPEDLEIIRPEDQQLYKTVYEQVNQKLASVVFN